MTAYGALWPGTSSPTLTRLGSAVGMTAGTAFNSVAPWGNMRRVNLLDNGIIAAYCTSPTGGCGYDDYGSNGQSMVQVPAFYQYTDTSGSIATTVATASGGSNVAGQKVVNVASTTNFAAGGAVRLENAAGTVGENVIIGSIQAGVSLTMTTNLVYSYAVSDTVTQNVYAWWISNALGDVITKQDTTTHTITAADRHPAFIVDGVAKPYALVAAYESVNTSSKLYSIAGVTLSTATKVNSRTYAEARGAGWELMTVQMWGAIQMLVIIEGGSLNSQSAFGNGIGSGSVVATGYTATAGTVPSGNTSYGNSDQLHSVSYRGIENMWGNADKWLEGIQTDASGNLWVAPQTNARTYGNSSALPYIQAGTIMYSVSGDGIAISGPYPWAMLPTSVVGGTTTTYFCDSCQTSASGAMNFCCSGHNTTTASNGVFYFAGNYVANSYASRIQYFPQ